MKHKYFVLYLPIWNNGSYTFSSDCREQPEIASNVGSFSLALHVYAEFALRNVPQFEITVRYRFLNVRNFLQLLRCSHNWNVELFLQKFRNPTANITSTVLSMCVVCHGLLPRVRSNMYQQWLISNVALFTFIYLQHAQYVIIYIIGLWT